MDTALSLPAAGEMQATGDPGPPEAGARARAGLGRRQKAAIIVRLLIDAGADLSLTGLPEEQQQELIRQLGSMRLVDKATVEAVVSEFIAELEAIGLAFPGGLQGALDALSGKVSESAIARLRREAGVMSVGDPWERIAGCEAQVLLPVLESESIEVGAVLLTKINVSKAAEILGLLPGEKARRIAYAMSMTGAVSPEAVERIGQAIVAELDSLPTSIFEEGPVERVGAILNYSPANRRDEVLEGLESEDPAFAAQVKKAIFTFANIPERIDPRDVPKITRVLDPAELVTALAAAMQSGLEAQAEFILENMSKRMADQLREEMAELGSVKQKDGEAAMNAVIAAIREMEAAGEILFIAGED